MGEVRFADAIGVLRRDRDQRDRRFAVRAAEEINAYLSTITQESMHQKTEVVGWLGRILAGLDLAVVDGRSGAPLSISVVADDSGTNATRFVLNRDGDVRVGNGRQHDRLPPLTLAAMRPLRATAPSR